MGLRTKYCTSRSVLRSKQDLKNLIPAAFAEAVSFEGNGMMLRWRNDSGWSSETERLGLPDEGVPFEFLYKWQVKGLRGNRIREEENGRVSK